MVSSGLVHKKDTVAIEITDSRLKLLYVRFSRGKLEIAASGDCDIAGNSDDQVAAKIQEFLKKNRPTNPDVISVIPSSFVISKNIEIPSIDKKEIKEIVDLQAGRHTPYSRDEIIMDYLEIGVFHERYTRILLIIVKKEVVLKRYDILKKAGLKAQRALLASEVFSVWCAKVFGEIPKDKPVALVHVDAGLLDFTVVQNGRILYLRSIPLEAPLAALLSDDAKRRILDELKKSFESYQAENIEALPVCLYLVGLTESIASVIPDIQDSVGIPVQIIAYLKMLPATAEAVALPASAQGSLVAVAAATAVFDQVILDLIPEEVKLRKEIKKRFTQVTHVGIYSMTALFVFIFIMATNTFFKNLYLERLLSSYTKENEEAQRLKGISDQTGIIKTFINQKGRSLFVLTELFNALPSEVFLNSVSVNAEGVIIFTGTADSMSRVFSLVTDLENNKVFKNVKVDFTKNRVAQGKEVADFGLTMSLEEGI